ncbi:excinuclease ABC subunit UvrA [Gilvimarinus agarilyticus]|uniref:excinuclease ABC subunit UvrA n=1 Tax=Gilvimarinus sp. 2_MG-2023 TaxID=3062666 RepID=UPI001C0A5656|nr:excinuclease ABC subunit UvrA [Gilvimarinus sp. 2_MG-2023]MBU2887111.1 excinuclease ABC subunit UvrA [Gilvimarinus agarilyticus]MDO6571770.1 excinuclease ABC subunit UvrA [Gilvimarinus sp. 2_MG-2023]
MSFDAIKVRGARQNNLKNLDLDIPLGEMVVVTGVSGSGKSTLAFDTIYAEGQRRYVETFSAYARQFLDRMDKPAVDSIDGIPPAIAIEQSNTVRTSRSTVGTMTELNDYLKLLFARLANLYCSSCGQPVVTDSSQSIVQTLFEQWPSDQRLMVCLPVTVPAALSDDEVLQLLNQQGYARIHQRNGTQVEVVQDRLKLTSQNRGRLTEALEAALHYGKGHVRVYPLDDNREAGEARHFSSHHHCPSCDISYAQTTPSHFSFNSPLGACETCKGFGRVIGVDWGLVIPDESKSLKDGAIKPIQTPSYAEVQRDLIKFAKKRGIAITKPWRELSDEERHWVLEGEGGWSKGVWYGVREFFDWLESKAYKMHIRVLLSKYRAYSLCTDCNGARLKAPSLWWRIGSLNLAEQALAGRARFKPVGATLPDKTFAQLPGLNIADTMGLPLVNVLTFFTQLEAQSKGINNALDEATELLLSEVRSRLTYLCEVGLEYLTLDRQSRTLSGGEVQRINLTTALGTSLVNTLFVLDEPSTGLHPRDIDRLVKVLHRLRDAGNSLLVVEHDPQVILAADRILDIGPKPGRNGGNIEFFGTPKALLKRKTNTTARYLNGSEQIEMPSSDGVTEIAAEYLPTLKVQSGQSINIEGACAHNLKNIDVRIPLGQLVCLTGVSGSGKSTLMRQVLYPALRKHMGEQTETPGEHRAITGMELVDQVVMVDQSPIGKTTRSTPATYVGAFDAIRKCFVSTPQAKERGYKPGTFSFNSGNGRCPTCQGNGFEHVEMQFLSDVYLSCPECNGKRFRDEILEIKLLKDQRAVSIADALEMTVSEALSFFNDKPDVLKSLQPLADVGLEYVQLGQAVPTLSGGEAQRLKLAGHLANSKSRERDHTLFLFDEPTTGLHFADIATLMQAFRQLQAAGHSLLIIEHNLDVIRAADWVIDIGPEGGDAGGELIAKGTPQTIMQKAKGYTARALNEYCHTLNTGGALSVADGNKPKSKAKNVISVHHAREHNLKNIDVTIPRDKLTVISGVSGSGKSTLAFDLIFGEGQRRYLESLNAYARQFVRPASQPDVDAIYGIPPAVAIEQRTSRGGRKSTVATLTEIYHYLRLMYVKLGVQHCPSCDVAIEPQTVDAILARLQKDYRGQAVTLLAPLVVARKGIYRELAQWAQEKGYPQLRVDGNYLATDDWPKLDRYKEHNIELPFSTLTIEPKQQQTLLAALQQALSLGNGVVIVAPANAAKDNAKVKSKSKSKERLFSTQRACPSCGCGFPELDPRLFSYNSKHGWCEGCFGTGVKLKGFDEEQSGEESSWQPEEDGCDTTCSQCQGQRLNPTALSVRFRHKSIAELAALPVLEAEQWLSKLTLKTDEQAIARDLLSEMQNRLHFLQKVGLNYLTLDRAAPTLSGGEAQRIRLAAQLGSSLQGVCYVLDEPTIGLHTRDNRKLLDTLRELQQQGNTVLVVEHDEDTMREADHIIDIGPRAGVNGGNVVGEGSVAKLMKNKQSLTGQMLAQPLRHPMPELRNREMRTLWEKESIIIEGANQNNLQNVDVSVPLHQLVAISGVSGSGKSTLVRGVLYPNVKTAIAQKRKPKQLWQGAKSIAGWQGIDRILEVDQTPIGKTPRSCPATYIGIWDAIRKLFAGTVDARLRGYTPARFSFNAGDGRCEGCGGQGMQKIEMNFLPDVRVPCDVCHGWRFNDETLSVRYKGKHIGDVLAMNIDDACEFFKPISKVYHALRLMQDVGLGYLTLGQQSPTLSGGEAQRIKLVAELAKAKMTPEDAKGRVNQHNLYVLDEPTVGLHMADVDKLLHVLHRLVDAGNSVLVIEHNLDVIAEADWVIDMGPEGGSGGGKVVAQGTPTTVAKRKRSLTGKYLGAVLQGA